MRSRTVKVAMEKVLRGLRPFTHSDMVPLTRLLLAADAWPPAAPPGVDDLLTWWRRRNVHPESDIIVVPQPGGELTAMSQVSTFRDSSSRLAFSIAVRPEDRCRGIGSALYRYVEHRAHSEGAAHISSPIYLRPGEQKPDCERFLLSRGFRVQHSVWQMRIHNIGSASEPSWPEGIGFRKFTTVDQDAAKWARLINRAFDEPATADMIAAQLAEPGTSAEGYIFAVDEVTGDEVGTCRTRIDVIGGVRTGYVGTVGVLPEYRSRGIAAAMILEMLKYLHTQGTDCAVLFVEDSNTTARRLYDKMGWRPVYRTDHYWKAMSAPVASS